MVALEAPIQATPRREPLSPPAAAFLAAYVRCRADIVAAAQLLHITLEAALDLLTDPAVASRMEVIDESQKRAARYAAIDNISHAATVLSDLAKNAPDAPTRQKAASNLYRASIWLVRIAENKVPPDRLPDRYRARASSPEGEPSDRFDRSVGATASPPSTHPHPSPALETLAPPQEAGRIPEPASHMPSIPGRDPRPATSSASPRAAASLISRPGGADSS